jgi:hypothetical protein
MKRGKPADTDDNDNLLYVVGGSEFSFHRLTGIGIRVVLNEGPHGAAIVWNEHDTRKAIRWLQKAVRKQWPAPSEVIKQKNRMLLAEQERAAFEFTQLVADRYVELMNADPKRAYETLKRRQTRLLKKAKLQISREVKARAAGAAI